MITFQIFFIVWIILGLSVFAFYTFNNNYALKRKLHPIIMILIAIIFLSYTYMYFTVKNQRYILIPFIGLITYMNIKMVRFCDKCGKTIYKNMGHKDGFCPRCGEKIMWEK